MTTRLAGDLGSADERAAANDEDSTFEVTRCSHLVSTADRRHSFHQLQSVQPADKRYYCYNIVNIFYNNIVKNIHSTKAQQLLRWATVWPQ